MTLDEMKTKEVSKLWSVAWRPSDWTDGYAMTYVVADTEAEAIAAMGIEPSDVHTSSQVGFGGVIRAN